MKRPEIKEKEIELLSEEYKKNPQLFKRETFIESPGIIEKFGIFIPGKGSFFSGYLKLWPQDFIVEEITKAGENQTINIGDFISNGREFSEEDPTIYATMVKCGLSTIETVQELTDFLKISSENRKEGVQFAGIKDKDAITGQLISFRGVKIKNLEKIESPYFFLKNVYSGKGTVETGNLLGNEFTVFVRTDKSFKEKSFLENLKSVAKEGFYNFFYLQRFGTPRLINFYWGLFILKGEYQKAVMSFLCSPGERELPYFREKREEIKKVFGDWEEVEKILEPFPLIFQNEKRVVDYLKENPKDFIGALNRIPEQVQLWVFAYSSLLFNKKLSSFLKKGIEPPEKLSLILSKDKNDWLEYFDLLKEDGIFSMPLKNLKPFPFIQWKKREIKTKRTVEVHQVKVIPEGVILKFFLPKAAYATAFLSHLFNLISGFPPENISDTPIDTKKVLGEEPLAELLNKFKEIIHSKTEDIFEK